MKISQLEKNLMKSKLQEKVDSLQVLVDAAIKYNADNRTMLVNDLIRAKTALDSCKIN